MTMPMIYDCRLAYDDMRAGNATAAAYAAATSKAYFHFSFARYFARATSIYCLYFAA